MNYRSFILFLSAVSLLFSGCEREIEGQIFIVTESRENIKLGLVEVAAVDQKEFRRIKTEVLKESADLHRNALSECEPIYANLRKITSRLEVLTSEAEERLDSLVQDTFSVSSAELDFYSKTLVNEGRKMTRETWDEDFEKGGFLDQHEYGSLADGFSEKRNRFLKKANECNLALQEYNAEYARLQEKLPDDPIAHAALELFYSTIPLSALTVSDSDGAFSLTLDNNSDYIVFARASRKLPTGKEENYEWNVPIYPPNEVEKKPLILSNHNQSLLVEEFQDLLPAFKHPESPEDIKSRLNLGFEPMSLPDRDESGKHHALTNLGSGLMSFADAFSGDWTIEEAVVHPGGKGRLVMLSKQEQVYRLSNAYTFDSFKEGDLPTIRATRGPSNRWPTKSRIYLALGETSDDNQLRFDSYTIVPSNPKILEAVLTHIPTGRVFRVYVDVYGINRTGISTDLSIPYAGLTSQLGDYAEFFVHEGQEFTLKTSPSVTYRVSSIAEDTTTLEVEGGEEDGRVLILQMQEDLGREFEP